MKLLNLDNEAYWLHFSIILIHSVSIVWPIVPISQECPKGIKVSAMLYAWTNYFCAFLATVAIILLEVLVAT